MTMHRVSKNRTCLLCLITSKNRTLSIIIYLFNRPSVLDTLPLKLII